MSTDIDPFDSDLAVDGNGVPIIPTTIPYEPPTPPILESVAIIPTTTDTILVNEDAEPVTTSDSDNHIEAILNKAKKESITFSIPVTIKLPTVKFMNSLIHGLGEQECEPAILKTIMSSIQSHISGELDIITNRVYGTLLKKGDTEMEIEETIITPVESQEEYYTTEEDCDRTAPDYE